MEKLDYPFVKKLFANLQDNSEAFFQQVADDVFWQVKGSHPLAGDYRSKEQFLNATFKRLNKVLKTGVILKVSHIYIDGMTAVVEMESLSTANNGEPFNNVYCWVVEFNTALQIVAVRAYLDSALVQHLIDCNE